MGFENAVVVEPSIHVFLDIFAKDEFDIIKKISKEMIRVILISPFNSIYWGECGLLISNNVWFPKYSTRFPSVGIT